MSKQIKLFKQTINIGGSFLPADFPYFDGVFISSILNHDFYGRIIAVYEAITKRKLDKSCFESIKNAQYPASVVSVDDGLNLLELFDGNTADYSDYIFDKTDLIGEISSIIAVFFSAYCDLIESGQLNLGDKFNVATTQSDANFLLALFIAKKIGLPIGVITVATLKPVNVNLKDCFFYAFNESEVDDVISEFFEEYDYPLDVVTAESFIPLVEYVNSYDDERLFLMPALISPYKFTRKILKAITNKNELSIDKAERLLYNETAMEIPPCIEDNKDLKFYAKRKGLAFQDVLQIIKQCI